MAKQSPFAQYLTPKLVKDIKFGIVTFVVMVVLIFHYAWIMRQLVILPELPNSTLGLYFGLFFIDVGVLGYLLLGKYYYHVYAEEIAQEKKELEEAKAKKSR
ncbi:uncharacterized protein CANTADRAFT_23088 [Suhomyces tanzawaensis NRRL Y-17324]|uniref:Uncharacterized protein n=1 Tax=Suhomyces tanzawaensis NRRL Y-17324 TaxID=984487 RepID=A0A1E4SEP0_9ASCO|nr:uncharacterized protein CANTADRAFT_23088 [Suhomyces tanzawaensis NRRL Y-17324]ODV77977.1 hypothetical protein CANTADRAFT_23088 [Suhomyces tanzawaensis NRRL Y-17324]